MIWFESLEDAKYFKHLLLKKGIFAWHFKTGENYPVVWDIGSHDYF